MWGNMIRYRSINCVVKEIKKIQITYGNTKIFIADDLFLLDKNRVYEFCTEIENNKLDFNWACLSRVDIYLKIIKKKKGCGCKEISYGCESGSNKILNISNKNISIEILLMLLNYKKVGISCRTSWIIGLPGETEETLYETAKLI